MDLAGYAKIIEVDKIGFPMAIASQRGFPEVLFTQKKSVSAILAHGVFLGGKGELHVTCTTSEPISENESEVRKQSEISHLHRAKTISQQHGNAGLGTQLQE